jgi:hypothetical protein
MPRARSAPRVKGPYSERGGARFRIRVCDATGQRDLYFSTLNEAQAGIRQAERELRRSSHGRDLGSVLEEHMSDKVQRGLCAAQNADIQKARLRGWLADALEEDIGKITPKRAAAYYEQLVNTPTRKTKQPPTAATHRFYLNLAQTLFRWAVRKSYIRIASAIATEASW